MKSRNSVPSKFNNLIGTNAFFVEVKGEMDSWTGAAEGSFWRRHGSRVGDLERRSIAISGVEGLLLSFFTFLRHTSLCSPSPSPNLKERGHSLEWRVGREGSELRVGIGKPRASKLRAERALLS